jgi:tRNA dimethylallyltransferase
MNNILFVLLGPTGVGKTELSLEIAEHCNCDIISCDSRQFYRGMPIGTAAPDASQLARVKHHFVQFLPVEDYYSASLYERDVLALLPSLFKKKPVVVMTGGSMLYLDAICKGIDDIPDTDPAVRKKYLEMYDRDGIESLRFALKILDPEQYNRVDLRNPRRIMRALEITESTGKPYSSFLTASHRKRDFRIIKAGINRERSQLFSRINDRVDKMVASGLEEEARSLFHLKHLNALKTVGYSEMFTYFDGKVTRDEAIELIKRNTRRYAKKQLTWWLKDSEIQWFEAEQTDKLIQWLDSELISKEGY